MSEQRQAEWKILEESAWHQLSNPDLLIANKRINLLLRLWQYAPFERHKVWAVYLQTDGKDLLIQRVVWNRQNDYKRISAPSIGVTKELDIAPRVSTRIRSIKSKLFEKYLEELQTIRIRPFINKNDAVTDGIKFGFEFKKIMINASFSWSCSAPEEWQQLETWFFKTKNFLDLQFANLS